MAKKQKNDTPVLANNRRAFHDYAVSQRMECGIQLSGTEVKSCRARTIQLQEGFVTVNGGEVWLHNVHISHYDFGNRFNHDVRRMRKLLLHKKVVFRLMIISVLLITYKQENMVTIILKQFKLLIRMV